MVSPQPEEPSQSSRRGGRRFGAGRPKGSRNRRTTEMLERVEREGLTPIDFLLGVMRNSELELRDRVNAAGVVCPFVHPRLSVLRTYIDPDRMTDAELSIALARLEQRVAEIPEAERSDSVTEQLDRLLEAAKHLPTGRQQALFDRLHKAAEFGLATLNDPNRPGAVPRPLARPGATPVPPNGSVLEWDPDTESLKQVPR
jgi:hypothetical protein